MLPVSPMNRSPREAPGVPAFAVAEGGVLICAAYLPANPLCPGSKSLKATSPTWRSTRS